jgi:peptidoglycan/LPS O-acetylase OafA/YrhL
MSLSFESSASHSPKYRPDVDGLRAIAVLAVLFFHIGVHWFKGGFIGVDIFYVISGYLITSILVRDMENAKFSLVSFYDRRLRRIFPALFTVLLFCILSAFILFDPQEMSDFGRTLLSTTFFVSNLYFSNSAQPTGYFDSDVNLQPLLHTWSLAVEEQFYLIFPITLFLLFRFTKSRARFCLVVLAIVSFAFNLWATRYKPILAFYWFMPRAWELLIGSLLALKVLPPIRQRVLRESINLLGLVLVVCSIFLSSEAAFPGYIVLLPCAGTWLMIYAGEGENSFVRSLMSSRPLVFVGVISYSLYLWHWPIFVFCEHLPFNFPKHTEMLIVAISSTAMAFLSFEYIERPFRGRSSRFTRRQIFALGAAVSIATAAFGLAAFLSRGLPERYNPETRQIVASNLARIDDFDTQCGNWKTVVHSDADINFCNLGNRGQHEVFFWGDSHVEQLYPALKQIYAKGAGPSRGVLLAVENGCLPDPHLNNTRVGFHCDSFAQLALRRAKQDDIDAVFLGFSTWWYGNDNAFCVSLDGECRIALSAEDLRQKFLADLSEEIGELRASGKRVIVCLPFPMYDQKIPKVEINNAVFGKFGLAMTPRENTSPSFREQIRELAVNSGAEVFDPRQSLCQGSRCLVEVDGISIYKDQDHLTPEGASFLGASLLEVLQKDRPDPTSIATESGPINRRERSLEDRSRY